jgi:hypothetical protein
MPTTKRSSASWSDVKAKLTELDRSALLALVHDLYAAGKENQAFLHTRFGGGGDVLKPYQATISRWLWPDVDEPEVLVGLLRAHLRLGLHALEVDEDAVDLHDRRVLSAVGQSSAMSCAASRSARVQRWILARSRRCS